MNDARLICSSYDVTDRYKTPKCKELSGKQRTITTTSNSYVTSSFVIDIKIELAQNKRLWIDADSHDESNGVIALASVVS